MSQLTIFKRRINSIKTTKKITHAMRLISMSLYSRMDEERKALEYHHHAVKNLFSILHPGFPGSESLDPEEILDVNPLIILAFPIKGLCGGLNSILAKYIDQNLFIEEHQKPTFITIGQKATEFVREHKWKPILHSYHELNSQSFKSVASLLSKHILSPNTRYSSVTWYHTYFKNFFTQVPQKVSIIPLKNENTGNSTINPEDLSWEQSTSDIQEKIAQSYLKSNITYLLFQSLISEYAARFVAMDNSTTNAEKYLDRLVLQFNKMRQALITREVSELSASL
jgi:F-type H+-transporting ATPase subunit gamma